MQNDFEKNIAQRMQDFRITPQPEIWQQVEAALPPEKKRRRAIIWWWLLPLAILLGGGVWLVVGKQHTVVTKNETEISKTASGTKGSGKDQIKISDDTIVKSLSTVPIRKDGKQNSPLPKSDSAASVRGTLITSNRRVINHSAIIKTHHRITNQNVNKTLSTTEQINTNLFTTSINYKVDTSNLATPINEFDTELRYYANNASVSKPKADILPLTKDTIPVSLVMEIIRSDHVDTVKSSKDTSDTNNTTAKAKKAFDKKKHSMWIVEAGLGRSWQRLPGQGGGSQNFRDMPYNSSGPLGAPQVTRPAAVLPKASFSYSVGITRKQSISRHWNVQLALQYQTLSVTQSYGSVQSSSFNNAVRGATTTYNTGDTFVYRNSVHQILLMPRIEYTINPASYFPVSVHTGFSLAYNISSNQLLHDYRTRNYLRSSALATKWLTAIEVGAGIFIHKKIYAGLNYQYGFSNVAKPALGSDYRWRVWQVRVGLPLFNHSSK